MDLDRLGPYVYGERPRRGAVVAAAAAVLAALSVGGAGLLGVTGTPVVFIFAATYGLLPAIAGGICGWGRMGYPAAAVAGVATGVAFFVVVTLGGAFEAGIFTGEDDPLLAFSIALAMMGFVWSTAGFAVGVAGAVLEE